MNLKCGGCGIEVDASSFDEEWKAQRKKDLQEGAVWYCFRCTLKDDVSGIISEI